MSRAALTVLSLTGLAIAASPAHADPTPKLIRELATGKRALASLIDPARGLLFMDHFPTPGEGPSTQEDTHACGGKLDALVKRRWPQIVDAIKQAAANGSLSCDAASCRAGGRGEWDPVFHFRFAAGTLRAIAIDDEVLVGADDVAREHARQARQLADLPRCP